MKFDFDTDSENESAQDEALQDDFLNFSFKHLSNLEALNKKLVSTDSPNITPRPHPKNQ
jgi:hypothetical protein